MNSRISHDNSITGGGVTVERAMERYEELISK